MKVTKKLIMNRDMKILGKKQKTTPSYQNTNQPYKRKKLT